MAVFTIFIIIAGLITAFLMMPVHVRISPDCENPDRDKTGFFRLNIDVDAESYMSIILHLFYIRFRWNPLQKKIDRTGKGRPSKKVTRYGLRNRKHLTFLASVAWQAVKKSRLNKLYLDLDTSNVILNANLYPFFELMSERPRINLNINYTGNFALCLDFQNNLWNFVRVLIWNLLKKIFINPKS